MNQKLYHCLMASLVYLGVAVALPANTHATNDVNSDTNNVATSPPIKYIVVLYQENVSFDHYFATYPFASNPKGERPFHASHETPRVNNLLSAGLLDQNPNSTQPFRIDRSTAVTCDQNHGYTAEQNAFAHGLMNKFPESTGQGNSAQYPCHDLGKGNGIVMGYFDGNTVTAIWNYAQHFAMSDNFFGTSFGPSTPGAINLVTGTTSGAVLAGGSASGYIANGAIAGALIDDADPAGDDCSDPAATQVTMHGKNVGDLLNSKKVTWGWFEGGFAATSFSGGKAICGAKSTNAAGTTEDYVPHHQPFQYFSSTANYHHARPSDPRLIGQTDAANHQYDLSDFFTALDQGHLPAISFVKAKAVNDGHAGYSDPLDEQSFLVQIINTLENSPQWTDMAIVLTYDDSDGWYDHAMNPVVNQSNAHEDALTNPGSCGATPTGAVPGRCGYGPRLPLIVISPYARQNYVDHAITDQSSILRFIEDNWDLGRIGGDSNDVKAGKLDGLFDFHNRADKLILDPSSGDVISRVSAAIK